MSTYSIHKYTNATMVYTDSFDLLLDAFKAIVRGMNKAILAINNKAYGEQHRILTNCTSLLHELANALPQTQDMESFRTSLATIFAYAIKTITNANRDDVVKAMEEFIEKTKNSYGNDTGKY